MIKVSTLVNVLKKNKCSFFTGVPDSILKELSIFLKNKSKKNHIIAIMKVPCNFAWYWILLSYK